jgi:hypothetical protein
MIGTSRLINWLVFLLGKFTGNSLPISNCLISILYNEGNNTLGGGGMKFLSKVAVCLAAVLIYFTY